ncbi:type II toxin-antitoxin system RelE/ParE family toxin [Martelella sp. HB161492]|uniref:type II toxin-antitoxin system RelE/ParE family toxin n=1 Tax=Martelella sp. HB161492 TaxID=2720726 RepID=UPI001590BAAE|nr:type II toxin-antitoxin system RelE/ParE family toxin [Martelella sp. HB161492]
MFTIHQTDEFSRWLTALRDRRAVLRIVKRIDRLALGNAGDVKPVGEGISELRIDYGPGYRVYYVQSGEVVYLLLCGGSKSTQAQDITRAKKLAKELRD